jgi:hypothetical protein
MDLYCSTRINLRWREYVFVDSLYIVNFNILKIYNISKLKCTIWQNKYKNIHFIFNYWCFLMYPPCLKYKWVHSFSRSGVDGFFFTLLVFIELHYWKNILHQFKTKTPCSVLYLYISNEDRLLDQLLYINKSNTFVEFPRK